MKLRALKKGIALGAGLYSYGIACRMRRKYRGRKFRYGGCPGNTGTGKRGGGVCRKRGNKGRACGYSPA